MNPLFDQVFPSELIALFNLQNIGIWISDGAGNILYINDIGMKAVGIEHLEEALQKNSIEISEFGYTTSSTMTTVLKTHKPSYQLDVITRTGEQVDIYTYPILDNGGGILFIFSLTLCKGLFQLPHDIAVEQLMEASKGSSTSNETIISESAEMHEILKTIRRIAQKDTTILLHGESGVGKDVIANYIHRMSPRKNGPFIPINCSAIPESLLESELFGYEKGAFTGANTSRMGLLEMANKGTVFLDEIGDLPLFAQVKLLRALQNRSIMRLGSKKTIELDVHFISATHQPLEELVEAGKFREDFYYRLNVIRIDIPPLRERRDDILPLCKHFLGKFEELYKEKKYFSKMTEKMLTQYSWPGNVRELVNTVEQAMAICPYSIISPNYLPSKIRKTYRHPLRQDIGNLKEAMDQYESSIIRDAVYRFGSSRKAATALGVDQKTILRKMHKYGIEKPDKK